MTLPGDLGVGGAPSWGASLSQWDLGLTVGLRLRDKVQNLTLDGLPVWTLGRC